MTVSTSAPGRLTAPAPAPASIGVRAAAYAIDVAIAGIIALVAIGLGAVFIVLGGAPANAVTVAWGVLLAYLFTIVVSLAWALVYTAMQAGHGSIGQRLLRIVIVDAEAASAIGFWRALLRNVVWWAACAIVVGYFTPLFDGSGRRRGWHDLAAGAEVVERSRAGAEHAPAEAVVFPPPPATPNPFLVAADPAHTTFPTVPAASLADMTHTDPHAAAGEPASPAPVSPPAPPAVVAPVIPVQNVGIISQVPGGGPRPAATVSDAQVTAAPAAAVTAAPASPAAAPTDATSAAAPAEAEDLDATRATASVASVASSAPTRLALVWDDGTRTAIYGPTVFGRNPVAEAGTTTIAVRDETLSLSKTHFEADADETGTWIADRHSTNGTVLQRGGFATPLEPGQRVRVQAGDRVEIGDRSLKVEELA